VKQDAVRISIWELQCCDVTDVCMNLFSALVLPYPAVIDQAMKPVHNIELKLELLCLTKTMRRPFKTDFGFIQSPLTEATAAW
jgi:hypothetical protein